MVSSGEELNPALSNGLFRSNLAVSRNILVETGPLSVLFCMHFR